MRGAPPVTKLLELCEELGPGRTLGIFIEVCQQYGTNPCEVHKQGPDTTLRIFEEIYQRIVGGVRVGTDGVICHPGNLCQDQIQRQGG